MSLAPDQCRGCSRDLTDPALTVVTGANGVLYCSRDCRDDNDTWEAAAVDIFGGIHL